MLDKLFLQILNMSFTASFVIGFVLIARLFLKKSPKFFSYALWSVVLFRLVCPFSFESMFSLLPTKANPISQNIVYMQTPKIDTGVTVINNAVNTILPQATPYTSINPLQIWISIGSLIWILGIAVLLIYSLVTLLQLKKRLQTATLYKDTIFISDRIDTAFVMGVFRPKIYLPANLSDTEREYILLHEKTHIKRLDHLVKLISFLVLCVHWFNPLVWFAFFCSGKDMEMSCDEAVIKQLGNDVKKDYSSSLLTLATGRRIVGGTPLAFGEGNTKGRIKNVLNYRKPAFWVIVVSVIVVIGVGIGLMANPKEDRSQKTGADELWENRTQYVGDNSAVGNIVTGLSFPENLKYDGFELHTAQQPYGITVNFKTDTQTRNSYTDALNEVPFKRNAIVMFSLIENVEQITFTLDDSKSPYSIDYTRAWAEDFMGEKQLFKRSETFDDFGKFTKEISAKISNRLEDDIKKITSITFPAYDQRTEHNSEIFDIEPFVLNIQFPDGWTVKPKNENDIKYPLIGVWTPLGIYNADSEYIGAVGYNIYEEYEGAEEVPKAIYNQIALGNGYIFNAQTAAMEDGGKGYTPVVEKDSGVTAITEVYIAPYMQEQFGYDATQGYNKGILSYNKDLLVYIAMELDAEKVSDDELKQIAKNIEITSLNNTVKDKLTFFIKPDESPEVIGQVAATVWLNTFVGEQTPAEIRISDYAITDVTVIAGEPKSGVKWEKMAYQYVVQVAYDITTATDQYLSTGDGVSGKGTFKELFRELCVKDLGGGNFCIFSAGTGGGTQEFAQLS